MTSSHVPIKKIIDDLSESYSEELFVQAIFSAVPPFSIIGGYLTARAAKSFRERVEFFMQETLRKLKLLGDYIDWDFLRSEEFAHLSYAALEKVSRTYQKQKIRLFSDIIVNSATTQYSNVEYKEQFIKIVDDLTPRHIQILKYVYEKQKGKTRDEMSRKEPVAIDDIQENAPEISLPRLESLCRELVNYSLLVDASLGVYGGYIPGRYFLGGFTLEFLQFVTFESVIQN